MSKEYNIKQMYKALEQLEESGIYDVEKYSYSLLHQTNQLAYFYCYLVKNGDLEHTYYHVSKIPREHQLAYFNIGRGFPKEIMDGHWCYVVKNMGYKILVIPCTSIKDNFKSIHSYEKYIRIEMNQQVTYCKMHLTDIRAIDLQRIDLRKPICHVLTPKKEIIEFIKNNLF